MIKTIKVKKQFRLDELLKYVWDNELNKIEAVSSGGRFKLKFIDNKSILVNSESTLGPFGSTVSLSTTEWVIEVEEEITEESLFGSFVVITENGTIKTFNNTYNMREIRDLLENYENEQKIYALIDNNLELIWEAE